MLEGSSRIIAHNKKNRYERGTFGERGGPGWVAERPARHGNEEADVGGGGGGGTCRGGRGRWRVRRGVVVWGRGRRGRAGDAPERPPRGPGRSRNRNQEGRSGPPRSVGIRHPDRQRRGQVSGGQRDH